LQGAPRSSLVSRIVLDYLLSRGYGKTYQALKAEIEGEQEDLGLHKRRGRRREERGRSSLEAKARPSKVDIDDCREIVNIDDVMALHRQYSADGDCANAANSTSGTDGEAFFAEVAVESEQKETRTDFLQETKHIESDDDDDLSANENVIIGFEMQSLRFRSAIRDMIKKATLDLLTIYRVYIFWYISSHINHFKV